MNHERAVRKQRKRRTFRVRKSVRGDSQRPRLSVFRSHKHIYAQVVDDSSGRTLVAANTQDKDLAGQVRFGGNKDAAKLVGKTIGDRAKAVGIETVTFDRGSFKYHGRVAAVAEGARESGLKF